MLRGAWEAAAMLGRSLEMLLYWGDPGKVPGVAAALGGAWEVAGCPLGVPLVAGNTGNVSAGSSEGRSTFHGFLGTHSWQRSACLRV